MTVSDGQAGWVRVARIVEIARKEGAYPLPHVWSVAHDEHRIRRTSVVRQGITLVSMNSDGTAAARHIGAVAESTLLVESALAKTSR